MDFVTFAQTCDVVGNSEYRGKLCHLDILARHGLGGAGKPFSDYNAGTVVAAMLVGSSMTHLNFDEEYQRWSTNSDAQEAFFQTLTAHESMLQLHDLRLGYLHGAGAYALRSFLPMSTRLRNLVVTCIHPYVDPVATLAALRQNGSLYSLSLQKQGRYENRAMPGDSTVEIHPFRSSRFMHSLSLEAFWTTSQLELTDAYCTRNKMIPILFQRPLVDKIASIAATATVTKAAATDSNTDVETTDVALLIPSLFVAATEAVRMAPTFVLMGLTAALGDVLGQGTLD